MLFLQISGNLPTSLVMPPFCTPIPSAQVLHVFFELIDRKKFLNPTVRAICRESLMELKPDTDLLMTMARRVIRLSFDLEFLSET